MDKRMIATLKAYLVTIRLQLDHVEANGIDGASDEDVAAKLAEVQGLLVDAMLTLPDPR